MLRTVSAGPDDAGARHRRPEDGGGDHAGDAELVHDVGQDTARVSERPVSLDDAFRRARRLQQPDALACDLPGQLSLGPQSPSPSVTDSAARLEFVLDAHDLEHLIAAGGLESDLIALAALEQCAGQRGDPAQAPARDVGLVDADDGVGGLASLPRPRRVTVAPKKTWSVASRAAGSMTSAASMRLVRKRMRRSISRRRRLP